MLLARIRIESQPFHRTGGSTPREGCGVVVGRTAGGAGVLGVGGSDGVGTGVAVGGVGAISGGNLAVGGRVGMATGGRILGMVVGG